LSVIARLDRLARSTKDLLLSHVVAVLNDVPSTPD
jgi:hypothetical protein